MTIPENNHQYFSSLKNRFCFFWNRFISCSPLFTADVKWINRRLNSELLRLNCANSVLDMFIWTSLWSNVSKRCTQRADSFLMPRSRFNRSNTFFWHLLLYLTFNSAIVKLTPFDELWRYYYHFGMSRAFTATFKFSCQVVNNGE